MIVHPFNRCHDSSQYSPSSSLSASCNDSAGIFKWLSDTAFSFSSRFFQPRFLIINIRAFVASGKFFRPCQAKFFLYTYALPFFFFFWQRQTGRISSYYVFYTADPSITRELVRNRSQIKTSGPSYVA